MRSTRLWAGVTGAVVAAACAVLTAAPPADPAGEFKTRAARDAMATYTAAVERAAREFQDKATAARRTCIAALNAAKDEATRASNLDEALRIRDAATRLQNEVAAAAPKAAVPTARDRLAARLANTVWDNGGKPYRFNADGTMTVGAPGGTPWQWAAMGDHDVVVRRADGWTECYTFDDDLKSYSVTEYGNGSKRKTVKRVP